MSPNPSHKFDITIQDNDSNYIEQVLLVDASEGVGIGVDSQRPHQLIVTAASVDSDPVSFSYAGYTRDSDSTECLAGAYDHGTRAIDCTYIYSSGDVESDVK